MSRTKKGKKGPGYDYQHAQPSPEQGTDYDALAAEVLRDPVARVAYERRERERAQGQSAPEQGSSIPTRSSHEEG